MGFAYPFIIKNAYPVNDVDLLIKRLSLGGRPHPPRAGAAWRGSCSGSSRERYVRDMDSDLDHGLNGWFLREPPPFGRYKSHQN